MHWYILVSLCNQESSMPILSHIYRNLANAKDGEKGPIRNLYFRLVLNFISFIGAAERHSCLIRQKKALSIIDAEKPLLSFLTIKLVN